MKSKKILIALGFIAIFALFYCSESYGYCWPIADSNGTIDCETSYIEYGYGKRTYTVDNKLHPNEKSYTKTENHYGVDITGTPNTTYKIVSVSNGTVISTSANNATSSGTAFPNSNQRRGCYSSDGGGYGNYVLVKDDNSDFVFMYAHLEANSITVKKGSKVKMGQILGTMGSSGDSGHTHLHFEIRRNISSALAYPSSNSSNLTVTTKYDFESNSSQTICPTKYVYTMQMNIDFVKSLYKNILGRDENVTSESIWVKYLINGKSKAEVISGFYNSQEFKGKNYSNNEYIEKLYNGVLQRNSDALGKKYYLSLLNNGISRNDVLEMFLKSGEFSKLCTNYYAIDFSTSLYKNILDRNPDKTGLNNWTKLLTSTKTTPAQVISGFYNSAEFNKNNYNNSEYIEKLYNGILQRNSDILGKKHYEELMNKNVSKTTIIRAFLNSSEYRKLIARKYGMQNVSL